MSNLSQTTELASDQLVDDCMRAYRLCRQAAAYCIDHGGELATLERLQALEDCAEVNLMLANFLLRSSQHLGSVANLCRRVTDACSDGLAPIEHEHAPLRAAYAACMGSRRACDEILGLRQDGMSKEDVRQDEGSWESFPASDPPSSMPPTTL